MRATINCVLLVVCICLFNIRFCNGQQSISNTVKPPLRIPKLVRPLSGDLEIKNDNSSFTFRNKRSDLNISNARTSSTSTPGTATETPLNDLAGETVVYVSTIAGAPYVSGIEDGPATDARFGQLRGIVVDSEGNAYISDYSNHRIRKITPGGIVSTLAGSVAGFADGVGNQAKFYYPSGVVVDANDDLYVVDNGNQRIRKVLKDGTVSTIAGNGVSGLVDGPGSIAQFNYPNGIDIDASGALYIGDTENHVIRKIETDGEVTTIAGNGSSGFQDGAGTVARFNKPWGLSLDKDGNIWVADRDNHSIRKVTPQGDVTTFIGDGSFGPPANGQGSNARIITPAFMVYNDASSTMYIVETNINDIRSVDENGFVDTYAGGISGLQDGLASDAAFNRPYGIAIDPQGNLLVVGNNEFVVRMISEVEIFDNISVTIVSPSLNSQITSCDSGPPLVIGVENSGTSIIDSVSLHYQIGAEETTLWFKNLNLKPTRTRKLYIRGISWFEGANEITTDVVSINSTPSDNDPGHIANSSFNYTISPQGTSLVMDIPLALGQLGSPLDWRILDNDGDIVAGESSIIDSDYERVLCLIDGDYTLIVDSYGSGELTLRTENGTQLAWFTDGVPGEHNLVKQFSLPASNTDVGIVSVELENSVSYCKTSLPIAVKLANLGETTINSLEFTYGPVDQLQTVPFSELFLFRPGTTRTLYLPELSVTTGSNNIQVSLTNINGASIDGNPTNNSLNKTFSFTTDTNTSEVSVEIQNYSPLLTSWVLCNTEGDILYSGDDQSLAVSNTEIVPLTSFCLPSGCYHFTMNDPIGVGRSGLTIKVNGEEVAYHAGDTPWGIDLYQKTYLLSIGDVLQPPMNLRVSDASNHAIMLAWDYNDNVDEFLVYRSTEPNNIYHDPIPYRGEEGAYQLVATLSGDAREFTDDYLNSDLDCYYAIVTRRGNEVSTAAYVMAKTTNFAGFFEGFEDDNLVSRGWITLDNDQDGHGWTAGFAEPSLSYEGTNWYMSYSWDPDLESPLTPDNYLVTPSISIEEGDTLYYAVRSPAAGYVSEHYAVLVGIGDDPTTYNEIFEETMNQTDWMERKLEIASYIGQTIRIAFRHHGSADQYAILLDNVLIGEKLYSVVESQYAAPPKEFLAEALGPHKIILTWTRKDDPDYFELSVSKSGKLGSYQFVERINGGARGFTLSSLDPNTKYFFQLVAVEDEVRSFVATSEARSAGLDKFVFHYFEGFEGDVFPPVGWTVVDNDGLDGLTWLHATRELFYGANLAYEGERFAGSPSISENNLFPVDNWIITPKILIEDTYRLRFNIGIFPPTEFSSHGESYSVLISTKSSALADFDEVMSEHIDPSPENSWLEREVDLSIYGGTEIFIAFRHYYSQSTYHLQLDNIRIGNPETPIPKLPIAPENLVAEIYSPSAAELTWLDVSDNEDGFQVQVSGTDMGPWRNADLADPNSTGLIVNDLESGLGYYFRVRTFNLYGASNWSNISSIDELITTNEHDLVKLISIFPNPSNENRISINISNEFADHVNCDMEIKDVFGRVLNREKLTQSNTTVDLLDAKPGIYFITINDDSRAATIKLMIR